MKTSVTRSTRRHVLPSSRWRTGDERDDRTVCGVESGEAARGGVACEYRVRCEGEGGKVRASIGGEGAHETGRRGGLDVVGFLGSRGVTLMLGAS